VTDDRILFHSHQRNRLVRRGADGVDDARFVRLSERRVVDRANRVGVALPFLAYHDAGPLE
jgi:hypothetical protein